MTHSSHPLHRLPDLLSNRGRHHLVGLLGGHLSFAIGRSPSAADGRGPLLWLTKDTEQGEVRLDELRAFHPQLRAALLRPPESSPFEAVRPDRRSQIQRLAVLTQAVQGALDVLIVPAAGLLPRVLPENILRENCLALRLGDSLDLAQLPNTLTARGYVRSPLVEDEGSFGIRGEIVDVWPADRSAPVRIELEFDRIQSIRSFDPESQGRTGHALESLLLPLGAEPYVTQESMARCRAQLQELADARGLPTRQARQLFEQAIDPHSIGTGRAFLPAFHPLVSLWELFGPGAPVLVDGATGVLEQLRTVRLHEENSYATHPAEALLPIQDHFVTEEELAGLLRGDTRSVLVLHELDVLGEDRGELNDLQFCPEGALRLETARQGELQEELTKARASNNPAEVLRPLSRRLTEFYESGYQVTLVARTETQAERLSHLFSHRGIVLKRLPKPELLFDAAADPGIFLWVAPLRSGFLSDADLLWLVTEEEIFGRRKQRSTKIITSAAKLKSALDDLRALSPGDYVIHSEHGVGRYQGLVHRKVGDALVDFVVIEYQGSDKLFVPVYRLNQVQRHSGSEAPLKLDRLGGQTFEKTKSKARKRARDMAFELLKLYAERLRAERPPLDFDSDVYEAFAAEFPYEETPDQAQAIEDVLHDLRQKHVMDRLVSGDVGYGKTEVAIRAAFVMAQKGRQTAILCPTTVLAEQHFRSFESRLGHHGINVRSMSRFVSAKEQTKTLAALKTGGVDVVVGTHRLLSGDVHFKNLGLLVVDEEQRFGVVHKERMKKLRTEVDVLTLSATPIPRTLSLAIGGMRDMSVIRTAPEARRAVRTFIAHLDTELIRGAIEREVQRGGQVYYVLNRIEGLAERANALATLLPGVRVRMAHGQMNERELEKTMYEFVSGEADVLVATAIIESGLDISRANTMFIERADMFGLAQLYQIRGRVGRSSDRGYCYLLVPPPTELRPEAQLRLEALTRHTELGSGFQIASLDMELRGAGDLLGAEQSGALETVGFELFSEMLEQAAQELSGHGTPRAVDPEISVDEEALLPETYIEEIGVRLSLYKRLASAASEEDIERLGREMEDRFGTPPSPALALLELMRLKVLLRGLRGLGLTATKSTATLHLDPATPLTPELLVPFLTKSPGRYSLTPDGRLTRRSQNEPTPPSGLVHADRMLEELSALLPAPESAGNDPPAR